MLESRGPPSRATVRPLIARTSSAAALLAARADLLSGGGGCMPHAKERRSAARRRSAGLGGRVGGVGSDGAGHAVNNTSEEAAQGEMGMQLVPPQLDLLRDEVACAKGLRDLPCDLRGGGCAAQAHIVDSSAQTTLADTEGGNWGATFPC